MNNTDLEKKEEMQRLNKGVLIFRCILFPMFILSTYNLLWCVINNTPETSGGTITVDTFCYGLLSIFCLVFGAYLKKIFLFMDKY